MASPGLQLGMEDLVHRRPDEGEGHAHEGDHEARRYDPPPEAVDDGALAQRGLEYLAPGHDARVPEPEEADARLVDDDAGHREGHDREAVGQEYGDDVAEDYPAPPRAQGPRGLDEGLLLDLEGHRVDRLEGAGPEEEADDDHEDVDRGLVDRRQDDEEGQYRQEVDELVQARQDPVGGSAEVGRGNAEDD